MQDDKAILKTLSKLGKQPVLTFITAAEYRFGALGSKHKDTLLGVLERLISSWPVLHSSVSTVVIYSDLAQMLRSKGKPIPSNDLWIAALAKEHSMPVITRDRHFSEISDVSIITW